MKVKFHRRVQVDLNEVFRKYHEVSAQLAEDFFAEFQISLSKAAENPRRFHFDSSGLRRCHLDRFPYHFLYDLRGEHIRIWVLRHDRRKPDFGAGRFPTGE